MKMDTADFLFPSDLEVTPSNIKKVLLIGSCLTEAYLERLRKANPLVEYNHILFNNADTLPPRSAEDLALFDFQYVQLPLRHILTDAIVRIADNETRDSHIDWLSLGKRRIDIMLDKALSYNSQMGLLSLVSTFFVPQGHLSPSRYDVRSPSDLGTVVHELNCHLASRVRKYRNCYLADVDMIANSLGKRFFLDDSIYFYTHGSTHFGNWREVGRLDPQPRFDEIVENRVDEFFAAVFRQMESIYRTARQIDQVKVVIFDLDETLWRGQAVEHYQPGMVWPKSDGWPLGIWEAIHHLRWRGIVTAIASKNDHEFISDKWADIVSPPFIKLEDFVVTQINWRPKPESIGEILRLLSLTAKSAVFVDDHPVEREAVKAAFPEIRVIGSNPYLTRRILLWAAETQAISRTEESKMREEMLLKQIQREEQRVSVSREEFLGGLGTAIDLWNIRSTGDKSFTRAHELVNKTNQFNTTTRRWGVPDYQLFLDSGGQIFAFSVKDRFTEYGLVGVIFAKSQEIVQYVMSCRVLGMDVEIAALSRVICNLRDEGSMVIFGDVIPTDVNGPCRDVYLRCGFHASEQADGRFELSSSDVPTSPAHVQTNFIAGA